MDSTRSTSLQQGKNLLKDLDEFLAMSPESLTVIDLEKEIVKRRDKLLYSLRDPIIYKEFTRFMSNSKSIDFLWAVNLFFSISFYPTIMKAIYGVQENLCLWVAFEFVSEVITFLSACVVCGCIREESIFRRASQWLLSCTNAKSPEALADFFHTIFYISIMLARSIDLVQRSVAGECKSSDWSGAFACNPNAKTGGFPIESFCILLSVPVPAYKGVRPGEEDHHPASPIKLCSSIEDEVIVKAPETVVVHRQPSTAFFSKKSFGFHSRKSVSSGFSGHSSHFSFMRSQMFHDPVSMNSGAYESIMTSMRSRRGFIGTNKVSPQSQQTIISPPKPGQSIRRTVSHLENPSDFESQRHVKVEQTAPTRNRISRASYISHNSNVSHDTNLSPATADPMLSQRTSKEKSGYMGGRETHDHGMMTSQLHGANVEGGGNTNSKNNSKRTVDVGNTSSSSPKAVSIHAKPPANQTQNLI
eukprot:gene8020-8668_t